MPPLATPSTTAQRVAAHRRGFERPSSAGGRPDLDDALARDVAADVEVHDGPMHRYLRVRTAFVDAVVLQALASGTDQVVVLGAGYDGRALRFGGTARWFEVDLPATQADKRARLARLGVDAPHVTFVAADFAADDVAAALRGAGLDTSRPVLAVLEGVAPYLEREVLASLLGAVATVAPEASRLVVTMSVARREDDHEGTARLAAFAEVVAALGEPLRCTVGAGEVDGLLVAAGWRRAPDAPEVPGAEARLGLVVAVRAQP